MNCLNPRCRDRLMPFTKQLFCPACRYMGRQGVFVGGAIVGLIVALVKLFS